mgnify:CR=1 FL=1
MPIGNQGRFSAPALPVPPKEYNQTSFSRFNNLLRIYFNQLDVAIRGIPGVSWIGVAAAVEYTGVETSIASGEVLTCEYRSAPAYRFISTAVNSNGYPVEDAFYRSFDGTNLSDLIVTREEN